MSNEIIRFATIEDAAAIREIYKPYVEETSYTFECETPEVEEFEKRIATVKANYPYIVYVVDGKVRGYAYTSRHKERAAYIWDVDLSVYLDQEYTGKGIGVKLYNLLMDISKEQNIYNLYGGVTSPNVGSEKLHKKLGFELCGTYKKTGYKFGEWHDVIWFGKCIGDTSKEPKIFKSIDKVEEAVLQQLLENALIK